MTINISIGDTSDGWISSSGGASYADARNGAAGLFVNPDADTLFVGQIFESGQYWVEQGFVRFPYTLDTDAMIMSAYIYLNSEGASGPAASREIIFYAYNWGDSITTGDFRTPAQLGALAADAGIENAENWTAGWARASNRDTHPLDLQGQLAVTGEKRFVIASSRNAASTAPSGSERNFIRASEQSNKPQLVWTTAPIDRLNRVAGASVQLSDGTFVYLSTTSVGSDGDTVDMQLRHHDGVSSTVIDATASNGFSRQEVAHAICVVADASDNLYLIGHSASNSRMRCRAYAKGSGHSWTSKSPLDQAMSSVIFHQFVGAWHAVGGTVGTILVLTGRSAHRTIANQEPQWALLNCDSLLAGSGTMFRAQATTPDLVFRPATGDFVHWYNETGSNMDVMAAPGTANQGYVVSVSRTQTSICRYIINPTGTGFTTVATFAGGEIGKKDGAGKYRVLGISESQFMDCYGDFPFDLWQIIGSGSTLTGLGYTHVSDLALNLASLAGIDGSFFSGSSAWDVVHSPDEAKVWLYYFDVTDPNRLMKTSFNLNSNAADLNEIEVSAAVGEVGSENRSIRVQRGRVIGQTLIHIANYFEAAHALLEVIDSFNLPPNAPVLTPSDNFDASEDKTLLWTFSDPNTGDSQLSYQIQIRAVGAGSDTVDSGKTLSGTSSHLLAGASLSNGEDWQWRVKTWDALDVEGEWSEYSFFSTLAGGTVTIIDPVADNPDDQNVSSYTVEWSVSGASQEEYRVQMFVNSTDEELYDSDWQISTDTTHLIPNIPSDVEVRFQVRVREDMVESSAGTRLYTTSYLTPPVPVVTVSAGVGYIEVSVSNPEPEGDVVQAIRNDIYRRRSSDVSGDYVLVGSADIDGSFRDYTVRSGVSYSYIVRGVGP